MAVFRLHIVISLVFYVRMSVCVPEAAKGDMFQQGREEESLPSSEPHAARSNHFSGLESIRIELLVPRHSSVTDN